MESRKRNPIASTRTQPCCHKDVDHCVTQLPYTPSNMGPELGGWYGFHLVLELLKPNWLKPISPKGTVKQHPTATVEQVTAIYRAVNFSASFQVYVHAQTAGCISYDRCDHEEKNTKRLTLYWTFSCGTVGKITPAQCIEQFCVDTNSSQSSISIKTNHREESRAPLKND